MTDPAPTAPCAVAGTTETVGAGPAGSAAVKLTTALPSADVT